MSLATQSFSKGCWPRAASARLRSSSEVKQSPEFEVGDEAAVLSVSAPLVIVRPHRRQAYFASRKPDFNLAFAQAKYIGALWMASLARQHPERRFILMSPGNSAVMEPRADFMGEAVSGQVRHAALGLSTRRRRGREAARRRC